MVHMESQHSVGWPIGGEFPRFVIVSEILRPGSSKLLKIVAQKLPSEIGKVVRCLLDKKQNFASLSCSDFCTDRTQNLPGPAPDTIPQISSKSAHFRQSYSRTREPR